MPEAPATLPAPLAELLRAHPRVCVILYGRHPALHGQHMTVEPGEGYLAEIAGDGALQAGLLGLRAYRSTPEGAFTALVERVGAREDAR